MNSLKDKHMNKTNLVNFKKDPAVKTGLQVTHLHTKQNDINGILHWEHQGRSNSFPLGSWESFMEEVALELGKSVMTKKSKRYHLA